MKKRYIFEWIGFGLVEIVIVFVVVYTSTRAVRIAGMTALVVGACVAVILIVWAWRNKRGREMIKGRKKGLLERGEKRSLRDK